MKRLSLGIPLPFCKNIGNQARSTCQVVLMQASTPMTASIRPLKSTFRKGVAEDPDAATDSAPERKSPERTKANQGMSHSSPTAPNKKTEDARHPYRRQIQLRATTAIPKG